MKKILSAVLALVMVAATFTMLVPTATAAEETPASTLVYSTDFEYDFGEGVKTSADVDAIAGKAGFTMLRNVENTPKGEFAVVEQEIEDDDGNHALHITNEVGGIVVVEDTQLMNGFEMYVDVNMVTAGDGNPIHFVGSRGRGGTWNVVIRKEKGILNALKNNSGTSWIDAKWDQIAISGFGVWHTLHIVMDPETGVAVRVKLSAAADEEANWSKFDTYSATKLETIPTLNEYLTGIIGIMTYGATTDLYLDNIAVYATDYRKEVVVYENNFDAASLAEKTDGALMSALGWKVAEGVAWHGSYPEGTLSIQDGAVFMNGRGDADGSYCNFRIAKDKALLHDYTVSFKMKYLNSSSLKADRGLVLMGNDGGHDINGTWFVNPRMNNDMLNGYRTSGGVFGNTANGAGVALESTNYAGTAVEGATYAACDQWFTVSLTVSKTKGNIITVRNADGVYTYVDGATAAEIANLQANVLSAYNEYLRIFIYGGVDVLIDDLKVTAYEKFPAVYGYQVKTDDPSQIRLLGVINHDVFTNAEKVGFRVTMTATIDETPVTKTKDIDCSFVYSSITQWGENTPTEAANMLGNASHIYALHIKGIDKAVAITVTPYYVDGENTYFGETSTVINYNPTPAN